MPILQVQHKTRDFDAWKQSFDSDPVGRQQGGVRNYRILRGTDDSNYVVIELEFESTGEAEKFAAGLRDLSGASSATSSASKVHKRGSWRPPRPASAQAGIALTVAAD